MTASRSELIELRNLGVATVNILQAIGITTREQLQEVGPVEAYRRIRARDIQVSRVMLYALQGALMDVHWNQLDPALKRRLVSAAEQDTLSEA